MDSPAAIVLVKQLLPDVLLVDAKLPVLNGIEAPRWIRAASPATHVIGMSIGANPKVVTAMREAGVTAPIIVGGIIPDVDVPKLKAIGVSGVFLPGTSMQDIIDFITANARTRVS